jgi:hypothetical protein
MLFTIIILTIQTYFLEQTIHQIIKELGGHTCIYTIDSPFLSDTLSSDTLL